MDITKEELLKPYFELRSILIKRINKNDEFVNFNDSDTSSITLFKIGFKRSYMETLDMYLKILEKLEGMILEIQNK